MLRHAVLRRRRATTPLRVARFERGAVRHARARVAGSERSPDRRDPGAHRGARGAGGRQARTPDRGRPRRTIPTATACATSSRATRCASSGRTRTSRGWRRRLDLAPALAAAVDCSVVLLPDGRVLHEPDAVGARRGGRPAGRARARHLRRRRRRRRPDRPRGGGVRRVRGAAHAARRARGDGRPGRHVLAHRELPRLPERRLGRRPRGEGARAGAAARRRDRRHAHDRGDHAERRLPHRDARRGPRARRARRDPRDGRRLPRARGRGIDAFVGIGCFYGAARTEAAGDAGPRRDPRRRRQLGRAGGDVLLRLRPQRDDPDPRREPGRLDVALPDRRARAQAERPGAHGRRDRALRGRRAARARHDPQPRRRLARRGRRADAVFIFIGADANTDWLRDRSCATSAATSAPGATSST